ncbi:MAG: sortase [Anaerolineae bacterium]|nr:sortase [Anaerolineae bacterium]
MTSSPLVRRGGNILVLAGLALLVASALLAGPSLVPYVTSRLQLVPAQNAAPAAAPAADETGPLLAATDVPFAPAGVSSTATVPRPVATAVFRSPTRIVLPAVGVDAVVVPSSWELVDVDGSTQRMWTVPEARLAGWHEDSAPLGIPGNTVISGHNWPQDAAFRDLYLTEPGDPVILYAGGTPFVYRVARVLLLPEAGQPLQVRQENARYIQPTSDERVTLVTCHPYGQLTHRLIVIARPVDVVLPEQLP